MLCEFCKQGDVLKAEVTITHEIIEICDECETVWYNKYGRIIVINYDQYMSERGIAPVWSEISII